MTARRTSLRFLPLTALAFIAGSAACAVGADPDEGAELTPERVSEIRASLTVDNGWNTYNAYSPGNGWSPANGWSMGNGWYAPNGLQIPAGFNFGNGKTAGAQSFSFAAGVNAANGWNIPALTINVPLASDLDKWITLDPANQIKALKYLASCALKPSDVLLLTYRGQVYNFQSSEAGGLAPSWKTATGMTIADQETTTSCMLARINAKAASVRLDILSPLPGMTSVTALEASDFSFPEMAYFGNIFAPTPQAFGCGIMELPTSSTCTDARLSRACLLPGGTSNCGPIKTMWASQGSGVLAPMGTGSIITKYGCDAVCTRVSSDDGTRFYYTNCLGDKRYSTPFSVFLRNQSSGTTSSFGGGTNGIPLRAPLTLPGLNLSHGVDAANGLAVPQGHIAPTPNTALATWLDADSAHAKELQYLAECALPKGTSIALTHRGETRELKGQLGFGPSWADPARAGRLSISEQERVSACLLARVNAKGEKVLLEFSPSWAPSAVSADAALDGAFFGNLFLEGRGGYSEPLSGSAGHSRACATASGVACGALTPLAGACTSEGCKADGTRWSNVLLAYRAPKH